MEEEKDVLSNTELEQEIAKLEKMTWYQVLCTNKEKLHQFWAQMLADPIIFVAAFGMLSGVVLSFVWSYIIVDIFLVLWWRHIVLEDRKEYIRRKRLGDPMVYMQKKVEELLAFERQAIKIRAQERAEQERKEREKAERKLARAKKRRERFQKLISNCARVLSLPRLVRGESESGHRSDL